jgi:S1-C subfamily serine protease
MKSLFLVVLFLWLFFWSYGQSEESYFDDISFRNTLQKGLESLAKSEGVLSLSELKKQLLVKHPPFTFTGSGTSLGSQESIYEQCKKSVLAVGRLYNCGKCSKWHTSIASGFAVGADGIMVTNYHVLGKNKGEVLGVMDGKERLFEIEKILAASESDDLVVLKLRNARLTPLPIGEPAKVGSDVWVISHPDSNFFTISRGFVSRYHIQLRDSLPLKRMSITADFAKGSSGGPVLNQKGEVVGVVCSTVSIHYNQVGGLDANLQMVVKNSVPVAALHRLLND